MQEASDAVTRLGGFFARHAGRVVLVWLLLAAAAAPFAHRLPGRLTSVAQGIPGTQSAYVREVVASRFRNPFADPLVLAIRMQHSSVSRPPVSVEIARLAADLRRVPDVARVAAPADAGQGARLVSADGHSALILIGHTGGPEAVDAAVLAVRAAVAPGLGRLRALDPGMEAGVTGPGAIVRDVIGRNARDSARAERGILVPALLLLLWVFGSPVASLLPLLLGVVTTTLALAAVAWVAVWMPLNGYAQTVSTMLGLALGIDYALVSVGRYREERLAGRDTARALGEMLRTAGWTVATSGLVVLAAMGALLPSGMLELESVGVGAVLTVAAAVAAGTTLLPALLALLDRWLDTPHALVATLMARRTGAGWRRWAAWVARHRLGAALTALVVLLVLAWPARGFQGGLPDGRWYPADLECAQGQRVLEATGAKGLGFPFVLVAARADGGPILEPKGVAALVGLSRSLTQHPEVADVVGPVDLPGAPRGLLPALLFYRNPRSALASHPDIGQLFVSADRRLALIQVLVRGDTQLSGARVLVRSLRAGHTPGLTVSVGGLAAAEVDLEDHQRAYIPWELALVFGTTFLLLFVAFRSVLVPLKAIVLNLLSVGAAMGCVVLVFQEGLGARWFGLDGPLNTVPMTLPLLIFCLTFGLSMDYEVFMLARVREARQAGGDELGAIATGLGATGGVITAAAGIMVVVFGTFLFVDMVLVKILGFGLAVAIALDATLVRGVLAPAVLAIAGRWNWWPGDAPNEPPPVTPATAPDP